VALKSVLKMAGKTPNEKSDGSLVFCFGNCPMGATGQIGDYSRFQVGTFLTQ